MSVLIGVSFLGVGPVERVGGNGGLSVHTAVGTGEGHAQYEITEGGEECGIIAAVAADCISDRHDLIFYTMSGHTLDFIAQPFQV